MTHTRLLSAQPALNANRMIGSDAVLRAPLADGSFPHRPGREPSRWNRPGMRPAAASPARQGAPAECKRRRIILPRHPAPGRPPDAPQPSGDPDRRPACAARTGDRRPAGRAVAARPQPPVRSKRGAVQSSAPSGVVPRCARSHVSRCDASGMRVVFANQAFVNAPKHPAGVPAPRPSCALVC